MFIIQPLQVALKASHTIWMDETEFMFMAMNSDISLFNEMYLSLLGFLTNPRGEFRPLKGGYWFFTDWCDLEINLKQEQVKT